MDDFLAVIVAIAVLGASIGGIFGLCVWGDAAGCRSKTALMGVEHSYGPLQGCMVKVGGQWMPLDTYRATEPVKR